MRGSPFGLVVRRRFHFLRKDTDGNSIRVFLPGSFAFQSTAVFVGFVFLVVMAAKTRHRRAVLAGSLGASFLHQHALASTPPLQQCQSSSSSCGLTRHPSLCA